MAYKWKGQDKFTDYAYLAQGRSLGKVVDVLINTDDAANLVGASTVNLFEVKGPDEAAMNLQVTLMPPKVIPIDGTILTLAHAKEIVDQQNASGAFSFYQNEEGNGGGVRDTPIIANLEWGIGGVSCDKIQTDISNGLNLNLTASFLRMSVLPDPLLAPLGVKCGSNAIYQLGAFVGPGYAKGFNAQRTIRFGLINPNNGSFNHGTSAIVPIPQFATRVTLGVGLKETAVLPSVMLGWVAQIIFFNSYGAVPYKLNPDTASALDWPTSPVGFNTVADNGNGSKSFPIPAGAKYAAIYNNNGYAIAPYLVFDQGF